MDGKLGYAIFEFLIFGVFALHSMVLDWFGTSMTDFPLTIISCLVINAGTTVLEATANGMGICCIHSA